MSEMIVFGFATHCNYKRDPSFKKVWADPLTDRIQIRIVEHGALDWREVAKKQPLIFWDRRPPSEVLAMPDVRIVWVPMWGGLIWNTQRWWKRLAGCPIRIISYSRHLTRIVRRAGIPVFDIQYFDDPSELGPVSWGDELNAFYWNRAGLLNREHLISLCHVLQLDHLYYLPKTDYYLPKSTRFSLPERVGKTWVHTIDYLPHKEYLSIVARTHLYIAPRWVEGIGVTVTEAMAAGCVVLANNAPTMNEYITHGQTGIFLPYNSLVRHLARLKSKVESRLGLDRPAPSPLIGYDWNNLRHFDLRAIGENARAMSEQGRGMYIQALPAMLDFIFSGW